MDYATVLSIVLILIVLAIGSLFSCLETAIVAVSEYSLKSLQEKHLWAKFAYKLKQCLNQILIFSLFGNSLANTAFTTLSTFLLTSLLYSLNEKIVLPIATLIIALFIIIFSEALPKIIAAKNPVLTLKIVAIPAYYIFIVSRPIIELIDRLIYVITKVIGIKGVESTTLDELKAIIADKRSPLKDKHRSIMLNSIELESIYVKEVLIPLRMVEAINMNDDVEEIYNKIHTTHHTRIIVFEENIDNIVGFLHTKDVLSIDKNEQDKEPLYQRIRPITFVNDFTPIIRQIHRAQKYRNRIFVVTNEYGDISGIACLEDMLEMIFGDFTTESPQQRYLAVKNDVGQLIVDGTMIIRELNELYNLNIEIKPDALTINGLVLQTLNGIPSVGVCFKLNNLIFEVINVGLYWVERVKIIELKSGSF
ncbi:MAG: CNNM domain-containing protein [Neisseriaceae bacterium]|jgi:Mg2+/Co2+ transporter CorB